MIASSDLFVEFDDFQIAHQHAARAERFADAVFVVGPVNVDVALVGIDVATVIHTGFEATQPKNATCDEIFLMGLPLENL